MEAPIIKFIVGERLSPRVKLTGEDAWCVCVKEHMKVGNVVILESQKGMLYESLIMSISPFEVVCKINNLLCEDLQGFDVEFDDKFEDEERSLGQKLKERENGGCSK